MSLNTNEVYDKFDNWWIEQLRMRDKMFGSNLNATIEPTWYGMTYEQVKLAFIVGYAFGAGHGDLQLPFRLKVEHING